jgi:hypothetical protein
MDLRNFWTRAYPCVTHRIKSWEGPESVWKGNHSVVPDRRASTSAAVGILFPSSSVEEKHPTLPRKRRRALGGRGEGSSCLSLISERRAKGQGFSPQFGCLAHWEACELLMAHFDWGQSCVLVCISLCYMFCWCFDRWLVLPLIHIIYGKIRIRCI